MVCIDDDNDNNNNDDNNDKKHSKKVLVYSLDTGRIAHICIYVKKIFTSKKSNYRIFYGSVCLLTWLPKRLTDAGMKDQSPKKANLICKKISLIK